MSSSAADEGSYGVVIENEELVGKVNDEKQPCRQGNRPNVEEMVTTILKNGRMTIVGCVLIARMLLECGHMGRRRQAAAMVDAMSMVFLCWLPSKQWRHFGGKTVATRQRQKKGWHVASP